MLIREESTPPLREIALKSGLIFSLFFLCSVVVAVSLYFNERRIQIDLAKSNQRQRLNGLKDTIASDLRAVGSDVMILAKGKTLAAFLATDEPASRDNLADEFELFANQKRIYDQIRFIADDGREMVRVNLRDGKAQVVAERDLQRKNTRYYFQKTLDLKVDEIYVSPFDLNVENDQVEQPHKPTIRFGTPIFDAVRKKRGVLVVNYLGQRLLDKLNENAGTELGQTMLLNADGFWLHGGGAERDWHFMFQDRRPISFADTYPAIWSLMQGHESGQVLDSSGLFTYAAVYPAEQVRDVAPNLAKARDYRWLIVSHIGYQQLTAASTRVLLNITSMLAIVALLLAIVSWLLGRALVRLRRSAQRLAEQERLAAIGMAMTALSHESRNALQRSQAGLEMLARRLPSGDDSQQLLEEIQNAQYQLRDMYEHARDWASPLQLHRETVDLRQLAVTAWDHLSHARDGRRDSIKLEFDVGSAICRVDREMLMQVIRNVFENSLAAANPVNVRVIYSPISLDRGLRLTIVDDGPGLNEEQIHRAFEPFFTTRMRGTGLGLAICRRIIEAHGGTITAQNVRSAQGNPTGTAVVIDLPRM